LEVLCTGHSSAMPYLGTVLKREPMAETVIIPTRMGDSVYLTSSNIQRYMRLYFPRTFDDLVRKYEFMLLEQIDSDYFTPQQFEWMRRGVQDAGLGGLQDRGVMSMHTDLAIRWAESLLSDAFPNDADAVVGADFSRNGPLQVIINEDPELPNVMKAFREVLRLDVGMWGTILMTPRAGSKIYTWSKTGKFPEYAFPEPGLVPHILGWRYGEGYTWSIQDIIVLGFWDLNINPYAVDVMISMLICSTGRKLPEDVVLVHKLRDDFARYGEAKGFILSLMDFVAKFGANTASLAEGLQELDAKWVAARQDYLSQEYASSFQAMQELLTRADGQREAALRLKDRALFWIYVIEWLSVSATFLVAGFAVWTLMVRRRLHREIAMTRLRGK